MFVCLSVHWRVCALVLAHTVCMLVYKRTRARGMHACSTAAAHLCSRAHVWKSDSVRDVADLFFLLFFYSCRQFFTLLANDTQRISLEATDVPVSELTRSATHVSNNQATFQPLDSGDPSTLLSLSVSPLFLSTSSSSSLQPAHQSAQNSSLKHYIIRHSSFTLATP